ncbi:MAG: hypothetical protein ACYTBJ_00005 [Planctomycetota bacterium]|jgi:hypothetical protein
MHEYILQIKSKDPDGKLEDAVRVQSKMLRLSPVSLGNGHEVSIEEMPRNKFDGGIPRVLRCGDTALRDQEWVELPDGWSLYLEITEIFDHTKNDTERLKRKICHNCQIWDRAEGQRLLTEKTHKYGNGSFNWLQEVANAISTKNKAQPLTLTIAGYCLIHQKLCAETSKACLDYKAKPWIARCRNWWVRAFR